MFLSHFSFQILTAIIISIVLIDGEEVIEKINSVPKWIESRSNDDQPHWLPVNHTLIPDDPLRNYTELKRCGEGTSAGIKVCVNYNRCDPITKEVLPEGITYAGVVPFSENIDECGGITQKCCFLPGKSNITTPNPPTPTTSQPPTSTTLITSSTVKPTKPQLSYCGIRNPNGLGSFTTNDGNDEAQYGEFPWIVIILKTDFNPKVDVSPSVCGGSLISPGVVLTAAHCVLGYEDNLDKIKVRAGEWDILTEKETYPKQERRISKIISHANYNKQSAENDFALMFLETPYTKAENIGTICLPLYKHVDSSKSCFTGGWGKKNFDANSSYSNILKKIELPIVSHKICQNELRKTVLGSDYILPETFICAGEYGKDTCKGDGGSPLVCPDPNNQKRYVQVGIVSWGVGCEEAPGVYADVAGARHWIDAIMAEEGYSPIPYSV